MQKRERNHIESKIQILIIIYINILDHDTSSTGGFDSNRAETYLCTTIYGSVDRTIVTNRSENDRFFFFLETIHARKKHIPILDILFKKEKCRYIIEIEFQSPSSNIRTKRKLEKRARVVPPEIGRGKNLFQSLRLFSNRKHWGRGERGKRIHQRGE